MRQWAPRHRHVKGPSLKRCKTERDRMISGYSMSLCSHFVPLYSKFVSLCSHLVPFGSHFVPLVLILCLFVAICCLFLLILQPFLVSLQLLGSHFVSLYIHLVPLCCHLCPLQPFCVSKATGASFQPFRVSFQLFVSLQLLQLCVSFSDILQGPLTTRVRNCTSAGRFYHSKAMKYY